MGPVLDPKTLKRILLLFDCLKFARCRCVPPDVITFNAVISACAKGGQCRQAENAPLYHRIGGISSIVLPDDPDFSEFFDFDVGTFLEQF